MKKSTVWVIVIVLAVVLLLFAVRGSITGNAIMTGDKMVTLKTTEGDIVIKLRDDMPITSGNFKKLAEERIYDGVIFHRVINGFMIQGGDPTGTGYGDPSILNIQDEFKGIQKNDRGTIAMANSGPNTGSSQFFINLVNNNFLDGKHPVFGDVVEGIDVVDKIAKTETDSSDRPKKEIKILSVGL